MRNILTFISVLALSGCGSADDKPAPNGEACEVNADCESELCLTVLGGDYELPGGLCTFECDLESNAPCGEHEACLIHNVTKQTACFQECAGHIDCREGWRCIDIGFWIPEMYCLPEGA